MNLHEVLLASRMAGKNNSNGGNVDLSDYYTKSQTDQRITTKVTEIVANAPDDFDTLKEISDWIAGHEDSAAAMNSAILTNTTAITTKVDKVSGKGLSTNDFTDADKSKLDDLKNYDDTQIKSEIAETAEQIALNHSTLGYQRKNLLQNNYNSHTYKDVTAIINADKSVTLSGSNANDGDFILLLNFGTGNTKNQFTNNKKFIPNGKYIVSGGNPRCAIQVCASNDNTASTTSIKAQTSTSPSIFTITDSDKYVWFRLLIRTGANFSTPVTVYPMIRPAEIADDTYEPYKPSVEERLTALENAILGGN